LLPTSVLAVDSDSDFWLLTSDFHIPAGISRATALA
jgi:hypothetical protein